MFADGGMPWAEPAWRSEPLWEDPREWGMCWDFEQKAHGAGQSWAWPASAAPHQPSAWRPPPQGVKGGKAAYDGPYFGDALATGGGGGNGWGDNSEPRGGGGGRGKGGWQSGGWGQSPGAGGEDRWSASAGKGSGGWPSGGGKDGAGGGGKQRGGASKGGGGKQQKGGGKGGKESAGGRGSQWQAVERTVQPSSRAQPVERPEPDEIAAAIEQMFGRGVSSVLQRDDFDFRVRRSLKDLRSSGGLQAVQDALSMLQAYTAQKTRESVNNWPAYLLTLLKRFGSNPSEAPGVQVQNQAPQAAPRPAPVAQAAAAAAEEALARAVGSAVHSTRAPAGKPLDVEKLPLVWREGHEALLKQLATSLRLPEGGHRQGALAAEMAGASPHALGVLRSLDFAENCASSAEAAKILGLQTVSRLPADSTAAEAADAATAEAIEGNDLAAGLLQEIGLELTVAVLQNPLLKSP